MPTCPKCGKEFQQTKGDRALRSAISLSSRAVPAMKDAFDRVKDCCNDCFKAEFRTVGQAILGTLDQVEGKEGPKNDDSH